MENDPRIKKGKINGKKEKYFVPSDTYDYVDIEKMKFNAKESFDTLGMTWMQLMHEFYSITETWLKKATQWKDLKKDKEDEEGNASFLFLKEQMVNLMKNFLKDIEDFCFIEANECWVEEKDTNNKKDADMFI